jgi:hypothetical protein
MEYILRLLIALICIQISLVDASLVRTKDVTLPLAEISLLENLVCKIPHNVEIETTHARSTLGVDRPAPFDSAFVKCKSHGLFMGSPMNYLANCSHENGKWACEKTMLETSAKINGKTVTIRPIDMTIDKAYQLLLKTSSHGKFQGLNINNAIGSDCNVSESEEKEMVTLSCKYIITLSYWCPQQELTDCPRVIAIAEQPVY